MAGNIDKGLYQAPLGMEQQAQDQAPLEIEVVNPDEVNIHADGLDISIGKSKENDDFKTKTDEIESHLNKEGLTLESYTVRIRIN